MLLLCNTSSLKSARTSAMIWRGEWAMYTLSGQVPEQVPHWMHRASCSQPGTLIISRPKPLTRSASYLTVRRTWIIGVGLQRVAVHAIGYGVAGRVKLPAPEPYQTGRLIARILH